MTARPIELDAGDRSIVRAVLAWEIATMGPQLALLAVGPGAAGGAGELCADLVAAVGLMSNIGASQAGDIGGVVIEVDPLYAPILRGLARTGVEPDVNIGDDERALWNRIWQQMQDEGA